jgi:hypothetical protein
MRSIPAILPRLIVNTNAALDAVGISWLFETFRSRADLPLNEAARVTIQIPGLSERPGYGREHPIL